MARANKPRQRIPLGDPDIRLAGGLGAPAARQESLAILRRTVGGCFLWEDNFYTDGESTARAIARLIPECDAMSVAELAIATRKTGLRHVPLFIASEMTRHEKHKSLVEWLLADHLIKRADEVAEFLAIYWKEGKHPIAACAKRGLARAFQNFDEYEFAKYDRDNEIKIRDVLLLVHGFPGDKVKGYTRKVRQSTQHGAPNAGAELFRRIVDRTLTVPDTWETQLSAGKDKKETFERLIKDGKLGALAFIRNLRKMEEVGVSPDVIRYGFDRIQPRMIFPFQFVKAGEHAPQWKRELEEMMFRSLADHPRLAGNTLLIIDVSGSMDDNLSAKGEVSRLDAAAALLMLACEACRHITIYATAGDDWANKHATRRLEPARGFAWNGQMLTNLRNVIGGGGIFTRQCLEYIQKQESGSTFDRIIVFSDSQDMDRGNKIPKPFGKYNYIVDVSAEQRGINYKGVWTAEVSGFSDGFLRFIYDHEANQ